MESLNLVGKEKKLLKKKIREKNFAQSNFDHKKKAEFDINNLNSRRIVQ